MSTKLSLSKIVDKEYKPFVSDSQIDDTTVEFEGFTIHPLKQKLFWFAVLLSLGFVWLLARWIPKLYVKFNFTPSSLSQANRICGKVSSFKYSQA